MIGKTIGHYRVLDKLGEGGMGEVYVAEDSRLRRKVALKILPQKMASDPTRLERFRREAQAVAALSHPNIVTIHSIEEAADPSTSSGQAPSTGSGQAVHFITMELVEGQSLDQMISGDGLSVERVIEIAQPLAEALAAAHASGIVHRDLKPANIMRTADGRVKILDFGLAKLHADTDSGPGKETAVQTLTAAGMIMGTVPYMSPEQVQGGEIDHRTDIFSFGVILQEMATGKLPFRGKTSAELISAILRDAPQPVTETRSDMPDQLGRIVARCLEKEPELRYQSAGDIQRALSKIGETVTREVADDKPSVAVLPFVDMSPEKDQDYFCEGLAEELINALIRIDGLSVASRTSAFRFKGSDQDIREIGRRLGVATVLEGSVRKAGKQVRISVQLVGVKDGRYLWSDRFDRELKDVFAIQDEIAQNVVGALRVALTPKAKEAAEKAAPTDVQAYDYYLRGRKFFYEFRQKGFELARQMFARAIVIDDKYARAYAGVADCCTFLYQSYESTQANLQEADAASRKAVEVGPDVAEAHASRGLALGLNGRHDEARAAFRRAIELNPKLYEAYYFQGRSLFGEGKYEEAAEQFEQACKVNPDDYQSPFFLAQTYLCLHRRAHASAAFRRAVEAAKKHLAFNADDARAMYLCAGALVELGELDEAQSWVDKAVEIEPDDALVLYNVACTYAQLGEFEKAMDCLERAVDNGMGHKAWIENDPYFDPLRKHQRFTDLIARMELL